MVVGAVGGSVGRQGGVGEDATAGAACEVAVGVAAFSAVGTTAAIGVVAGMCEASAGPVTEAVGEAGRLRLRRLLGKCLWQCLW